MSWCLQDPTRFVAFPTPIGHCSINMQPARLKRWRTWNSSLLRWIEWSDKCRGLWYIYPRDCDGLWWYKGKDLSMFFIGLGNMKPIYKPYKTFKLTSQMTLRPNNASLDWTAASTYLVNNLSTAKPRSCFRWPFFFPFSGRANSSRPGREGRYWHTWNELPPMVVNILSYLNKGTNTQTWYSMK